MLQSREPQVRKNTSTRSAPYRAGRRTRSGSGVRISWRGRSPTIGSSGPGSTTAGRSPPTHAESHHDAANSAANGREGHVRMGPQSDSEPDAPPALGPRGGAYSNAVPA